MSVDGTLTKAVLSDDSIQNKISSYEEYFLTESNDDEDDEDNSKSKQHVTIDEKYLDFGAVTNLSEEIPQQKSITVFNHTKGKLFICWNSGDEEKSFKISPSSAEIPPLKSYSFRITFKPVSCHFFKLNLFISN
jgi:hypothetical protein